MLDKLSKMSPPRTQRDLARSLGIPESRLSEFLRDGENKKVEIAIRICRKLNIPTVHAERTCGIIETAEIPK